MVGPEEIEEAVVDCIPTMKLQLYCNCNFSFFLMTEFMKGRGGGNECEHLWLLCSGLVHCVLQGMYVYGYRSR